MRRLAASGVRGLILSKASGWDVVKAIAQTPMKAVVIDTPDGSVPRPLPNVAFHDGSNSDRYVGAIGFAHFAGRGNFRHYGFVPVASGPAWSDNRRDGFLAASRASGKPCSVFDPPAGADEDHAALREWLRWMPKPCAIMGANDRLAMEILDACRQEKIDVPAALCLLGVDDNESATTRSSATPQSRRCQASGSTTRPMVPNWRTGCAKCCRRDGAAS